MHSHPPLNKAVWVSKDPFFKDHDGGRLLSPRHSILWAPDAGCSKRKQELETSIPNSQQNANYTWVRRGLGATAIIPHPAIFQACLLHS